MKKIESVCGVIPARYASSRFPGKPLVKLQNKEMILWVVEASLKAQKIDQVVVATDDERIYNLVEKSGYKAVMTSSDLQSGTDRVWEAVQVLESLGTQDFTEAASRKDFQVILNIQGDEPLIQPLVLDQLVESLLQNPTLSMGTLARPIKNQEEADSSHSVKVLLNRRSEAIYFSRFPIPFSRYPVDPSTPWTTYAEKGILKHIGVYGFRRAFLKEFCETSPTEIEMKEGLEQLRALYLGAPMKVVQINDLEDMHRGVDTPDDLESIEKWLKSKG